MTELKTFNEIATELVDAIFEKQKLLVGGAVDKEAFKNECIHYLELQMYVYFYERKKFLDEREGGENAENN